MADTHICTCGHVKDWHLYFQETKLEKHPCAKQRCPCLDFSPLPKLPNKESSNANS